MTEEIKEILDYLKKSDKNKFGFEQGKLIDYEETQLLLDCITNLQKATEQTEIYKSRCEKAMELINKNSNYPTYYLTGNIVKELKNILNGSDEK